MEEMELKIRTEEIEKMAKTKEEEFKIEDAFQRLEEITKKLADPSTDLHTAMELYAEGVNLSNKCKENLEGVATEIKILSGEEV